jgi:hypothetical protein
MTKDDFTALFHEVVFTPAESSGYRFVRKSQTLAYDIAQLSVFLVRLGGRMAIPGAVSHVLCARHKFLRALQDLEVPSGDATEPFDCPYKFALSELEGLAPAAWQYTPRNLNYPYDQVRFADKDGGAVREQLESLCKFLTGPVVEWAESLTPEKALLELRSHGEDAWCERVWIEDYEAQMNLSKRGS